MSEEQRIGVSGDISLTGQTGLRTGPHLEQ